MENKTVSPLATNMDEFLENFSVERVIDYIRSGELPAWLRDKHEDDKADAVEAENINSSGMAEALRSIFGVEYAEAFEKVLSEAVEAARGPEEKGDTGQKRSE